MSTSAPTATRRVLLHRTAPAIAMAVAITVVSSSAPLTVLAHDGGVPPLAAAFWRNGLAAIILIPLVLLARRAELRRLTAAQWRRCAVSGTALAVHFGTWLTASTLTDVATATALVCTQPLWTGVFDMLRGRRPSRLTWIGILAAVAGAALATGAGVTVSAEAVIGDVLALVGAIAGAVYMSVGHHLREAVSTVTYTGVVYTITALVLLAVNLAVGTPLWGYAAPGIVAVLAITAGPQFLGHSLVNFALERINATAVSVLLLIEVPGAAVLGWLWLDQVPPPVAWPGLALVMGGVAVALLGGRRRPDPALTEL